MNELFQAALEYKRMDLCPIPLAPGAKCPPAGFPLADHFDRLISVQQEESWYAEGGNVGVVTNRLVVVDFDNKDRAREFYRRMKEILKTIVETRWGIHFYFQAPCPDFSTGKFEHGDLKSTGGYVVAPPSTVFEEGVPWRYRFIKGHSLVPVNELPIYEPTMVPPKAKTGKTVIVRGQIRDAVAYVMTIESIQGKRGSDGLVRACAVLRDAGLSESEAMVVLLQWNSSGRVQPEWPLNQIARACSRTFAKGASNVS